MHFCLFFLLPKKPKFEQIPLSMQLVKNDRENATHTAKNRGEEIYENVT